jgi:hypothetical protein
MMKPHAILGGLLALALQAAGLAQPAPPGALQGAVVLVIRHAEKSKPAMALAPEGVQRARAMVDYFQHYQVDGQPLKLDYLIAASDFKTSHHGHPREGPYPRLTLEPLAAALRMPIDNRFNDKKFDLLAGELRNVPHGKAILVALHHEGIPPLLYALGADPDTLLPNGSWPEGIFNWVIQLRFDGQGRLAEARRCNQKLMPGDPD